LSSLLSNSSTIEALVIAESCNDVWDPDKGTGTIQHKDMMMNNKAIKLNSLIFFEQPKIYDTF